MWKLVIKLFFKNIGNRKTDVWDGEPECIYIPCNQEVKIKCVSRNCELFIAGAKYDKILEPFVIRSNEIDLVQYGSDETKTHRKIKHLLGQTKSESWEIISLRTLYSRCRWLVPLVISMILTDCL